MIKIVHFSITPCAGSAIRLVNALNMDSNINANLVDSNRWDKFDHDLVFGENLEKVISLVADADIIHLHNYLHLDSKEFRPINFRKLKNEGKKIIRQLRGNPFTLSRVAKMNVKEFINLKIPSMVIGQFMERYYPNAYVVPNIIPENHRVYQPKYQQKKNIYFAPTFPNSAWTHRWETKGSPEVDKILNKFCKIRNVQLNRIKDLRLNEALKYKQDSNVVIDDLVTGSYHISTLEGLSMGKPVLTYLDSRTTYVMKEISGSNNLPIINIRLEELNETLNYLFDNEMIIDEIGKNSRKWIVDYWSEKKMISKYIQLYNRLLENEDNIKRQKSLKLDNKAQIFFSQELPDIIYYSRKKTYLKKLPIFEKIFFYLKNFIVFSKKIIKKIYLS